MRRQVRGSDAEQLRKAAAIQGNYLRHHDNLQTEFDARIIFHRTRKTNLVPAARRRVLRAGPCARLIPIDAETAFFKIVSRHVRR